MEEEGDSDDEISWVSFVLLQTWDHYNGNCIKPYVCANHKNEEGKGMWMDCGMRQCNNCTDYTESSAVNYCDSCSYTLKSCRYCDQ